MKAAALLGVLVALLSVQEMAVAQAQPWDAARLRISRDNLEELLSRFEAAGRSTAYSADLRARADAEAEAIRNRLSQGDFRVGDRIVVTVRGQPQFSDTFTVGTGRVLELPIIPGVPLGGVLRTELVDRLAEHLGEYVKDPDVRARALIRLSIVGDVARPGYYTLPAAMPLTDVLMSAGGPNQGADLENLRIERGSETLVEGNTLQSAMQRGLTLAELDMRSGDRLRLPSRSGIALGEAARFTLIGLPSFIFALSRIF